jgi:NitT/TauT family transport system substrate-binding protein
MMSNAGCSPLLLAAQEKIFERHGLQVELKIFASRVEATQAWTTQSFDLLCFNLAELLLQQQDYKVLLIPAYSNGADVLVARKDAGSDLNDLKGARIGVPPISMGDLLLTRALDQHTLAREDFTVLPEEPQDLREALQKSEIQLAIAAPPYSLDILKNPDMQIIFRSTEMPGEIIDTIAMRADLYQSSPQLLPKMESVWQETLQYMQKGPEAAFPFLAQALSLPVPTIQQDYKFLTLLEQRDYLQPEGRLLPMIDQLQSSLIQSGSLKNKREAASFLAIPTNR